MKVVPFNEGILIRPFPKVEKTEGGVIIPDTVQERPSKATVLEVSEELNLRLKKEGVKDENLLKTGDVIHHVKNCGTPIGQDEEGKELYMVRYVEIFFKEA